ncbi:presequence protease [Holotrichia oblita]|uniref:Presequence protease n=1 Tax=Holotrichia oblita TaxID=644536 RepID=A0ACB9TIZ3_HOLOL|nr:presequence protease [Holotrichia oblita]
MIEPNFSGGYISSTGFDTQTRDCVFTIGLQGLKQEDFPKVIEIYDKTIEEVLKKGFDMKHIESVLHRYEIGIKHETSNFGLHLLFGIISTWNHNGDIINALRVNTLLEKLQNDIKSDKYFLQKATERFFKNNKHRLVLTLSPDKTYEQKQLEAEAQLIKSKTSGLTQENKQSIYETGLELLKEQNSIQNTNILPTLTMEDISNNIDHVNREKVKYGPVPTQINKVNSNGITYFRGIINTSQLTPEQHMLLPLFCSIITKMGTKRMNYRDFDNLVMTKTAGLDVCVHFAESLYQLHVYEPGILLSSYCLDKNVEGMWELWKDIFNLNELKDVKRFETLVHLYMSNLTHGVADSGHAYAMQSAAGLVSGAAYQKDLLTGLQHISYMKTLVKTKRYESILMELSNIAKQLFDKNNLRHILLKIDSVASASELSKSINILEALYFIKKAWDKKSEVQGVNMEYDAEDDLPLTIVPEFWRNFNEIHPFENIHNDDDFLNLDQRLSTEEQFDENTVEIVVEEKDREGEAEKDAGPINSYAGAIKVIEDLKKFAKEDFIAFEHLKTLSYIFR